MAAASLDGVEEGRGSRGQGAGQQPVGVTRRKVPQRTDRRWPFGAQVRVKRCGKSAPAPGVTRAARQTPLGARPNRGTDGPSGPSQEDPSPGRPLRWMATHRDPRKGPGDRTPPTSRLTVTTPLTRGNAAAANRADRRPRHDTSRGLHGHGRCRAAGAGGPGVTPDGTGMANGVNPGDGSPLITYQPCNPDVEPDDDDVVPGRPPSPAEGQPRPATQARAAVSKRYWNAASPDRERWTPSSMNHSGWRTASAPQSGLRT